VPFQDGSDHVISKRAQEDIIMFARRQRILFALSLTALVAAACGDDATGVTPPTVAEVSGGYTAEATTGLFVSALDGEETDLLAAGASVMLVLAGDGTTSGALFIPAAGENEAVEADLDGSWTLSGFRVTLAIEGGTFLDGLELTWMDGTLDGAGTFEGDTTFEIELEADPS